MKKMISLVLAVSILFAVLPCVPIEAGTAPLGAPGGDPASYDEVVEFTEPFSGCVTIGNTVKSIKISYSDSVTDEMIANTTGAYVVVEGGRTEALELTLRSFRIKAPDDKAGIDFGNAGDFDHKLYIEGNCRAEGSRWKAGIHVPVGAEVTIDKATGVPADAGASLTAIGGDYAAGIGGNSEESGGIINIKGGTVTASSSGFGAGIGGGGSVGSGGVINISGGVVRASGGVFGAGIGGGWSGTGGIINISGGTVITNGSYGGAGIGGGRESYASLPGEGDGGTINISGGVVTAGTGGPGAAIGGGWGGSAGIINISGGEVNATGFGAAAIGNGSEGTGGTINISGGTVTAVRGNGAAGIGGGGSGAVGTINITGGVVTVPADGDWHGAGIGGGSAESGGTINIGGGTVNVVGGTYASGIGGGSGGASGNISISGGVITAAAGVQGAGIGGGVGGQGDNISISDGVVTAYSTFGGAGIGGGNLDTAQAVGNDGGNITISGGTITATCKSDGAGIGGGLKGNGGNIAINGGTVTATSGDGTWDNSDGAGIGGGGGGNGGTITINAGTVNAKGAMFGAGIGGGSNGTGGAITINGGTVNAAGGQSAAGIGGGIQGSGGTVNIGGGSVTATGGDSAAGIGGGAHGAGANVTISNTPVVIATAHVDDTNENDAQHIGHGTGLGKKLDPGTLKNSDGVSMSYLRVSTTNTSGLAIQGTRVSIKGSDTEGYTDSNGSYQTFVAYTDTSYEIALSKPGFAPVRRNGIYSTSNDIKAVMVSDNTPPTMQFIAATRTEGDVFCDDYGEYGILYFVPKGITDYTSKAVLDAISNGKKFDLEYPANKVHLNANGLKEGSWQIYAADSAENVSEPLNLQLPFELPSPGYNTNKLEGIEISIPISELSGAPGKYYKVSNELAALSLPSNMLTSEMAGNAKFAVFSIEKADVGKLSSEVKNLIGGRPVLEFSLKLDGKPFSWNNPDAPVIVSIPYEPTPEELKDPEHIVVLYIDGKGNVISVPDGKYNPTTGYVTFSADHFSCYAISYVKKTFSDISKYKWARNQIEILASKGIADGTVKDTFSPGAKITRGDFLVMLVRTLGLNTKFNTNFADVKPGTCYYEAAGIAKKLGLSDGDGNNSFNPTGQLTRQDMLVLTARALKMQKMVQTAEPSVLDGFADKAEISGYAAESLAIMVKEGLIEGTGGRINPRGAATRAEAAVFLYRIYNKK